MDSKNFAIGILSTTAVILLAALVIIHTRPDPAFASGVTTTSGLSFKIPGRVGDSPIIGAGLFVDNDVAPMDSTWLERLTAFLDETPDAGAVGPKLQAV